MKDPSSPLKDTGYADLVATHDSGVTVHVVGDDEAATSEEYGDSYQALIQAGITVITDTSPSKIRHIKFRVVDVLLDGRAALQAGSGAHCSGRRGVRRVGPARCGQRVVPG